MSFRITSFETLCCAHRYWQWTSWLAISRKQPFASVADIIEDHHIVLLFMETSMVLGSLHSPVLRSEQVVVLLKNRSWNGSDWGRAEQVKGTIPSKNVCISALVKVHIAITLIFMTQRRVELQITGYTVLDELEVLPIQTTLVQDLFGVCGEHQAGKSEHILKF